MFAEVIGAFKNTPKYYEKIRTLGKNMTINTRRYKNWLKDYPHYPLYGWKRKMAYVVSKIHGNSWNQGIPFPDNRC